MAHQHKRTLKPSSPAPKSGEFLIPASRKRTAVTSSAGQIVEHYIVGDRRRVEQLRADRQWFSDHRAELARQLPNRYLAIVGQRVVDSDSSREALARRVYDRSEPAIFMPYTGEVTDTEIARQPSPRAAER